MKEIEQKIIWIGENEIESFNRKGWCIIQVIEVKKDSDPLRKHKNLYLCLIGKEL